MAEKKQKWDPIARMLEGHNKTKTVEDYLKISEESDAVMLVDINKIIRWKYKDRPENELGDIAGLAETFKSVGQQQPCIIRASKEYPEKYELIIGERRWKAAEKAGLQLKCIIKDIDDKTAALIQAIENDKRKDISEYSKGMSYAEKIEAGLVTQTELINILHISKQQISRLLSYSKIPDALAIEISDFRKVSSRTAEELVRLSRKSDEHLSILIGFAKKIRDGKYGANKINQELERILNNEDLIRKNKVTDSEGNDLFIWEVKAGFPAIHFSKNVTSIIKDKNINLEKIMNEIKECVLKNLS